MIDLHNKKKLLIVDDESLLLWALKNFFESEEGMEVKGYASAEEALEKIGGTTFDLAILDIRLPGADGISLMHELKSSNMCNYFILISGLYDKSPLEENDYPPAFYQYMPKSFSLEEIKNTARKLLYPNVKP